MKGIITIPPEQYSKELEDYIVERFYYWCKTGRNHKIPDYKEVSWGNWYLREAGAEYDGYLESEGEFHFYLPNKLDSGFMKAWSKWVINLFLEKFGLSDYGIKYTIDERRWTIVKLLL